MWPPRMGCSVPLTGTEPGLLRELASSSDVPSSTNAITNILVFGDTLLSAGCRHRTGHRVRVGGGAVDRDPDAFREPRSFLVGGRTSGTGRLLSRLGPLVRCQLRRDRGPV